MRETARERAAVKSFSLSLSLSFTISVGGKKRKLVKWSNISGAFFFFCAREKKGRCEKEKGGSPKEVGGGG